ncbi:MFS transporter [Paraburkholderia sediminicola]|uniref:MFS transporter n=1 Tax=Paraburkholderia sediminicola TaxID=458836 RepID=UPI0038BB1537
MSTDIIDDMVDGTRVNSFHVMIMFWCSMLMLFDGYDLVIYGSVLPQLMVEWKLPAVTAGIIGSSALFGMVIGALSLGSSSDRFGRRRVILTCLLIFGDAAFGNGFCENSTQFVICRFFTGVGLGGMVPNIVALVTEMSPKSKCNIMVTVMLSFFSVGGVIAAVLGKVITPTFGWRANFLIAGPPLLALPILFRWLPESIAFLLANRRFVEADRILRKLAPGYQGSADSLASMLSTTSVKRTQSRTVQIFKEGRAADTLFLWIAFGMCMLMVYGHEYVASQVDDSQWIFARLASHLPYHTQRWRHSGRPCKRLARGQWGGKGTLILFFAVASVSIGLLGYRQNTFNLNVLLMLAGATTIGTLCIVHAFAAQFYPANVRSTGIGWAAAARRFGAVAGPALGGYLVSTNLPITFNFMVFAVLGVIAAIAIALASGKKKPLAESTKIVLTPAD